MFKRKKEKRCNRKLLGQYPCDIYLKNALRDIDEGCPDSAYSEICWAILKSGGELDEYQRRKFEEVQKRMYG